VASRYESLVSANRPNDAHGIALQLVGTGKRVLELGAAGGHVTRELIARDNSVVAVEIDETLRENLLNITSEVIITDLDRLDLIEILDGQQFDVVLAGDVLEHTVNTRLILEEIRQLIRPDGFLVLSVPNIAHGDVRLALLNGEFRYRDTGILDRTHRVFFTRQTLIEFLEFGGFQDLEVFSSTAALGTTEIQPELHNIPNETLDHIRADPLSSVYQIIVRARPIQNDVFVTDILDGTQLPNSSLVAAKLLEAALVARDAIIAEVTAENARLRDEMSDEQDSLVEIVKEIRTLLLDSRSARQHDSLELQDWALGVLAELGEARSQILHNKAQLQRSQDELAQTLDRLAKEMTRAYEAEKRIASYSAIERQIEAIHASTTWRIGRFFMIPIRIVRRALRR
jgi:2-polyprenyl-3-methyl-5-hydroxy-6-metoxy-1,4-benzoquinol methylase